MGEARFEGKIRYLFFVIIYLCFMVLIIASGSSGGVVSAMSRTHQTPTTVSEPRSFIFIIIFFKVYFGLIFWFKLLSSVLFILIPF